MLNKLFSKLWFEITLKQICLGNFYFGNPVTLKNLECLHSTFRTFDCFQAFTQVWISRIFSRLQLSLHSICSKSNKTAKIHCVKISIGVEVLKNNYYLSWIVFLFKWKYYNPDFSIWIRFRYTLPRSLFTESLNTLFLFTLHTYVCVCKCHFKLYNRTQNRFKNLNGII